MKIETQFLENHQAKLIVEVEADQMEEMKRRAASKLARRIKIPGFRPGKAPYPVIQRTVGEAALVEEAMELLVNDIYPKVIEEANLKPYGPGKLEKVASIEPITLEFVVPLDAQVTLGDYRALRRPYEPKPVTDEDIEKAVNELRGRQAVVEPVEREAQSGDVVTVILSGVRKDGDEEKVLLSERSIPVIIRSGNEEDFLFEGFSKNFIGLSADAEGVIEHTFSDDDENEALRGVLTEFRYKVENVKSRTLPELDDEFAKSLGEFETLSALQENVRKALEAQVEATYNETYDDAIVEQTIEATQFLYPPQMLEDELDQVIESWENRLSRQGLDMDIYLKSREQDMDALREELKPVAEKRLKRGLVLFEVREKENIQIENQEFQTEAVNTLSYLQRSLSEKEARQLKNQNVRNNVINNVVVDLMTRKTVERLRDIFSGKLESKLAADEALKEESAESAEQSLPEPVSQDIPTAES